MRISIKIKFSIFSAILLLLTVIILSGLVLEGIKENQQEQYEEYLKQQAKTANLYFIQTILSQPNKDPQTFLNSKGLDFAEQLRLISGQAVVLYNLDGDIVNIKAPNNNNIDLNKVLTYALGNKTAYQIDKEVLYYLAPLKVGTDQVGVVQFNYSLSKNLEFYNDIKQMFLSIGAGVFLTSFIIAYIYYNSFANSIIKLKGSVERIRKGDYETIVLRRKDEIGKLSEGIHVMSEQIKKNIQSMEEEQKKLTLAVHKLSKLDQQQKEFIGNVTHEFKTPLTSIKAHLDLLEMYPDDETLLETAKSNIKRDSQKLYEIVSKVLELSALEKYDFEYHKEKINVEKAILQVITSLKGKMDKFNISCDTYLNEVYVEADQDSLTLILVNLIDNAIKYNKAKGNISIKNYIEDQQVIIEISDTGIGIPEVLVEKIFEPFYTVDKNRSRQTGGVGLGLSLARKHVEMQKGKLSLIHTGADGSMFRITFPVYQ